MVSFYKSEGHYMANMYYFSSNLLLLITFKPISVIAHSLCNENLGRYINNSKYNQKTNKCCRLIYNKQLLSLNDRCMNRAPVTWRKFQLISNYRMKETQHSFFHNLSYLVMNTREHSLCKLYFEHNVCNMFKCC